MPDRCASPLVARPRSEAPRSMDTKWLRNSFVYLIILVAIIALFFTVVQPAAERDNTQISLSDLAQGVKKGDVKKITASEDKLTIEWTGRGKLTARKEGDISVPQLLQVYGVTPDQLQQVDYTVENPPPFTN